MGWYCDECGEKILNENNGWVEWKVKKNNNNDFEQYDLRLVHHNIKCQYNSHSVYNIEGAGVSDNPLEFFSGCDGLMNLLEIISDNSFQNNEEVLELIKRIHIKGYEEVRQSIDEAYDEGVFDLNSKQGYITQGQIKLIQDWKSLKE